MKRAIYDGVLLLDESLPYEVVELPLPRDSPVELLEPESGPPKEPHGRNAAEKREILDLSLIHISILFGLSRSV